MFGCISCHIANYIRSVDVFAQKLQTELGERYSNPEIFCALLDAANYNLNIQNVQQIFFLDADKDETGIFYICKKCKRSFLANKLPNRLFLMNVGQHISQAH